MEIHVLVTQVGGFAREDAPSAMVVGAYTNAELAKVLGRIAHAEVRTIQLDHIPPGYVLAAKELGVKLPGIG